MPQPKDKTKVSEWKQKISNSLKGRRVSMSSEFSRGIIPWNKGLKGTHFSPKTEFKKGHKPANYMGGMKLCKDGIYIRVGKKTYPYIDKDGKKIEVGKYEQLARKKYRDKFGKFDKNKCVFHKDGDIFNNEIENLELIDRKELLKRNQYQNKKQCIICGKEFLARTNYCKTCSKKCCKENCKRLNRLYSKTHREKYKEYNKKYRAKKKLLISSKI